MKIIITILLIIFTYPSFAQLDRQQRAYVAYWTTKHPRNTEADVIILPGGEIICFYTQFFGGYLDNAAAEITSKISYDNGKSWVPYHLVSRNIGLETVISVSTLYESGTIWLWFMVGNSNTDLRPYLTKSTDDGQTWTAPEVLTNNLAYWIINNNRVIKTASGRLVAPMARISDISLFGIEQFTSSILYSDDEGATWVESNRVTVPPVITAGMQEPGVVELSAGNLLMYSRVQQGVTGSGVQWFSNSTDNGETWGTPYASTMISPMAPAKVIKLQDGRLLAAHCYSTTVRAPLVLSTSNDNGATWSKVFTISDFPDRDITYPSILERDGYLYITHWEQLRVKPVYSLVFTKIALADL